MKNFTFYLITCMLLIDAVSFSQPGSLDSSFGTNGKVIKPAGNANAVSLTSDGQIIAAGHSSSGFTLVKYKMIGGIDKSFGVNGTAIADFGDDASVSSIVIKPNGKIIAAGTDGKDFAIARFNADGSLDSSFGINGKVITDFSGTEDEIKFVTVNADNKIIAIGTAFDSHEDAPAIAVAVYNSNGAPDSSFSRNGKLTVHAPNGIFGEGSSAILQPDGKIVVIGAEVGFAFDFILVRYRLNGTLDKTFGGNGFTFTDFDHKSDIAVAAATQSSGKIIVAGYSTPTSVGDYTMDLVRYTKDGKLDSTFGVKGKVMTTFNKDHDAANGIVIQADDKIVVTGSGGGIEIARFTKNGMPDKSFGGDGSVNIDSTSNESVSAVTLQRNGKIIAAGSASGNFLITRLQNDILNVAANADDLSAVALADAKLSSIKLYPNPANDFIYIESIPKECTLTIYSEKGNAMMQGTSYNGTYSFNIKQLPAGVYYVEFMSKGKLVTKLKFIKQY